MNNKQERKEKYAKPKLALITDKKLKLSIAFPFRIP